ncbi:TetR/AcrR family transcriptional regulator C-terminal domain-containing protein [Actinoplanes sp. L3-i22]|uniref:TetR/AcrR family transcriptional regulator C-terminal domain-containing protein n=1 Tax=Actinoplanes sp. L3-i22 TaxID=2836373 RepID=UPI001C789A38|nr:TetR/AcrR family transcriptional regulator C-terminal domain-containing protein [Actinoplanes sp. L3-i22]BCY08642.1 TetR family transcriptional regulator [Actinoplanes sp. L3-i22]
MPSPSPSRRGRPPVGTETLNRPRIVAEAMAMAEESGLDAVTWRGLARRLGADPMSLYRHVDGREALLDAITEFVLAEMELPAATGRFRADVHALAGSFRAAAIRYPRCAPLVLTRQLGSFAALAPVERVLAVLHAAGLPPERAVPTLRAVLAYLIGTLLRELDAAPTAGGTAERLGELTAAGLPHVAEAAPYLSVIDHRAEFDYGLDLLIDAIMARHDLAARA